MKFLFVFVVVILAVFTQALRLDSNEKSEIPDDLIREKRQFFGGPFGGMGMGMMGMPMGGYGYGMGPWGYRRFGGMGMGPMMWG
uniref:Uncharacterized protein n=1 Tax=Panagrellus redivivus TaxID=6233 RepID=A0A7E4ZR12_PANRE